jgi:hypothetical protein
VEIQPLAQFLTGADGNYYFDLVPGNYIIRATDRNPNPAEARDDPNTPLGFRQHYRSEWRINEDWFFAPDRTDPVMGKQGEILQPDRNQAPTAFRFGPAEPRIPAPITDLNFLLKPSDEVPIPPNTVVIRGSVIADVNADSVIDVFDAPAGNMRIYYDSVRNGQYDVGEQFVLSNPDGTYEIVIQTETQGSFVIGVDLEPGWAPSAAGGDQKLFVGGPGSIFEDQIFYLDPPNNPTGSGLGNITGFVWNDLDGDRVRDGNETGIGGFTVYIDTANFGTLDPGEVSAITGASGGYFFPNLPAGTYRIDVVNTDDQQITTPTAGFANITLAAGETRSGVAFGIKNLSTRDFGDLPDSYNSNGNPSHFVVDHFRLGNLVSREMGRSDGGDNMDASGGAATDDGVTITSNSGTLRLGNNVLTVRTSGVGGTLTGWIDWDGDQIFQPDEQLTFIDNVTGAVLGTQADLSHNPAGHELRVVANADIINGEIAMRLRWGELGLTLGSEAFIGEVEDYLVQAVPVVAPARPGDFNDDGGVNAADYVAFRKFVGTSFTLPNTTNPSAPPVPADETLWRTNFGKTYGSPPVPSLPGDFNDDGGVNAADHVVFRKFIGTSVSLPNSTNPGGPLVAADETLWSTNFGSTGSGSSPSASSAPASGGWNPNSPDKVNDSLPPANDKSGAAGNGSDLGRLNAPLMYVGTSVDASSFVSFDSPTLGSPSTSNTSGVLSDADALLLLDRAIAELEDTDDETPLADRKAEDEGYDDLALAAVFDDDSTWWSV